MENDQFDNMLERQNTTFIPWQISYKNNSPERMQEIQRNLKKYSWTDENLFTDFATFRSNFNYDKRTPEQQKVLDDFYKNFLADKIVEKLNNDNKTKKDKAEGKKADTKSNKVPKEVKVAKESPSYTDESLKRHQEIINNLYGFYESNPERFVDRAIFEKVFEYDKRSDRQKKWLDSFWDNEVSKNDLYI